MSSDTSSAQPDVASGAFSSLPLSPAALDNLQQLGYLQMTPI